MPATGARTRVVIMGAAGRDFHNFNVVYRDDPACEVVAFTAAQIAGIAGRRYPAALAGPLYLDGIPIVPEDELEAWVGERRVDQVVFAYSDVAHAEVMHQASRADLDAARCTIEEREEYEPHLAAGNVVFAGVDTAREE